MLALVETIFKMFFYIAAIPLILTIGWIFLCLILTIVAAIAGEKNND